MSNNSDDINFDDWGSTSKKDVSDKVSDTPSPNESPKSNQKRTTKKMSDKVSDTQPEIHLEDLIITGDDFWKKMLPKAGALKNWLTINHPKSETCKRSGAVSEITLIFNELITEKLKQFQAKNSK